MDRTPTPDTSPLLGDRFRLGRRLGSGGMATVYRALDLRQNRPVAVKVLHPDLAAALGPDRFRREIHVASQLTHSLILPVLDAGETPAAEGPPSRYAMPLATGESLRDRLQRSGVLPVDEARRVALEIADALDFAHRQGVIHRDIMPENILLIEGHAVIADFGIAPGPGRQHRAPHLDRLRHRDAVLHEP